MFATLYLAATGFASAGILAAFMDHDNSLAGRIALTTLAGGAWVLASIALTHLHQDELKAFHKRERERMDEARIRREEV